MASGHVNRANRPNTWPQPTSCTVKKTLANGEPSTRGTSRPWRPEISVTAYEPLSGPRAPKAGRPSRANTGHCRGS
jgi:hypothetical protein